MKRTFNSENSTTTDNMASSNINKSAEMKAAHQTGVINRARTTFNTIGDAWKQKPNAASPKSSSLATATKSTKTTNSPTATNKTIDFFSLWVRHKKISNKTKLDETDENLEKSSLKDTNKYNVHGFDTTDTSSIPIKNASNRDKEKNILVDNSNKHQNKKKVMDTTTLSSAHTAKSNIHTNNIRNIKEKRRRHCLSRNTSLDLDLLAQENSTNFISTQTLGQSYDDINVDYGHQVIVNQRRNTFGESDSKWVGSKTNANRDVRQCKDDLMIGNKINDRENYVLENEEINEDSCGKGVIKARLRLAKLNSRDESTAVVKPGILHRRSSIDSPTTNRKQDHKNSKSDIAPSGELKENQLNVARPRKKLSFKEPVECSKFLDLKSDTIPRATKFLEEYQEQRSGSLDFELEVCVVFAERS